MNNKCQFITENNSSICKYNKKYGYFCYKHRREYLIVKDTICKERFTGLEKDYLRKDIIKYRKEKMKIKSSNNSKSELFNEVKIFINSLNEYNKELQNIIKIQSIYRGYKYRKNKIIKCNNDEDFYTYDLLNEIPNKYFYSYKDYNNIRWGFDIRSLHKLFQMNMGNPYTTETIPQNIVNDVNLKIEILKNNNEYDDLVDNIKRNRKDIIKQKIVDLFSFIEQSGYTCHVDWFLSLSIRKLKQLYKELEDIWNYRSQLNEQMKINICPPDANIFKTPLIEVLNYNNIEDLQELIIHEVTKFTQANNDSDRKLGFMYFLAAFGHVSHNCYLAHIEWLSFML
jgi:hypothetical protein